jgi:phage terminase small subunit
LYFYINYITYGKLYNALIEVVSAMTPKQDRFVEEYLIDLNATQAAIRAGYSPKYANSNAPKLLQNTSIRARVDAAIAAQSRRTGVTADRVVRELARVAFVNAPDVINVDEATLRGDATRDDTAAISSVRVKVIPGEDGDGTEREIKLADKLKALELLGRHLGMFDDKLTVAGALPVQIVDDIPDASPPKEPDHAS